jgi:hypothetical protein
MSAALSGASGQVQRMKRKYGASGVVANEEEEEHSRSEVDEEDEDEDCEADDNDDADEEEEEDEKHSESESEVDEKDWTQRKRKPAVWDESALCSVASIVDSIGSGRCQRRSVAVDRTSVAEMYHFRIAAALLLFISAIHVAHY